MPIVFFFATLPLLVLLSTAITSVFVYFGWNGCHTLLGVREIFFGEAFWLSMLVRAILTVSVNSGTK